MVCQNLINYKIFYTGKKNEKAQTEFEPDFSNFEASHCQVWPI